MLSNPQVVIRGSIFEGDTIHTCPLHESESSAPESQDLSRLMSHARIQDIGVLITCRLKYPNNQISWKSELKEQNKELFLKSELKEQNSELFLKSELKEQNKELFLKSELKEQNKKLFLKSELKEQNKELFLKSELKEQNKELFLTSDQRDHNKELSRALKQKQQNVDLVETSEQTEQNNKLIGQSEQPEQNNELIGQSEQPEQNNKLIGQSEHKEHNNKLIGKSEQTEQNNELIGQSEHKEHNNKLIGQSEQTEQNNELIGQSEHKEHNNKLIGQSEQTEQNNELIGQSEHKEHNNKLIGQSEHKEHNNKLIGQSEHKEHNNKLIGQSEHKEHNNKLIGQSEQTEQNNELIGQSEHKEHNNKLIGKSEQTEQNNELIGQSEHKEHNNKLIGQSEQTEQNNELIGQSEHKEHNNELIFKCWQKDTKSEFILKSEPKEQNSKFILQCGQKEQNNTLVFKSEQKEQNSKHVVKSEQNNEYFGKFQQTEQNYACQLSCFWCRESQNATIPSKNNSSSGVSSPALLTKISSLPYPHAMLNELYACQHSFPYDGKKIRATQLTSILSADASRLALKLSVNVWLQLLQELSSRAASLDDDSRLNPTQSCTALKSDMQLLMVNPMNINKKFISDCKNSMCVILGKPDLNIIRRNCLNPGENTAIGHNTKAMCQEEIIFLNIAQIIHKEYSRFPPAQMSCSNRHHTNINAVDSCGQTKCTKYGLVIFNYIINTDTSRTSAASSSPFYAGWSTVPLKADAACMPADPNSPEKDSNAEQLNAWGLATGGTISICLTSIQGIDSRITLTSSIEDENCLAKARFHRDVLTFKLTRILFCRVCYGYQVIIFRCTQNVKRLILNDQLPNKNKQFVYFLDQREEDFFCHITSTSNLNILFHHSDCHKGKDKRLYKLHHNQRSGKQHGYRNSRSIIYILFTGISLETIRIHDDVKGTNHHNVVDHEEPCWKYLRLLCYMFRKECSNYSKLCPQLGDTGSTNFLTKKMSVHVPHSTLKHYFTRMKTAKDLWPSFDGTVEHLALTSTEKERTKTITIMESDLQIVQHHKQTNIWYRMPSHIRSAFCQKTRRAFVETDSLQKSHTVIKSGRVKGRQAMISSNDTDFNQNASETEVSEIKEKSIKTAASSTIVHSQEDEEESGTSEDEEDELTKKSNRIKSNIECMDNFLIVWHSGFLILFLFLLGVGIVLRVYFSTIIERSVKSSTNYVLYSHFVKIENVPDKLEFGNLTEVLGESLIILSSLYIACVLSYMTFLIHRITFTIPLVVIVTGAVVLTEVNIINIYMSPVSAANEEAKKELKERAEKEYSVDSNKPFSVTYDLISIWGHCCGIVDQYDFQNVILKYFLPAKSEHRTLQVPPTCCEPSYFEKGVEDVVECAGTAEGIFNVGCYQTIYIWLRLYCNLYSLVVILQLLDLCIHIILYKKHLSLLTLEEKHIQNLQQKATLD